MRQSVEKERPRVLHFKYYYFILNVSNKKKTRAAPFAGINARRIEYIHKHECVEMRYKILSPVQIKHKHRARSSQNITY